MCRKLLRHMLHSVKLAVEKERDLLGALEVWGDRSSTAQEDIVLLDKNSQSCFFFPDYDLVLSLTVCCTHMNPVVPSEPRRTLGFLTKKPCIHLEDRMRPQPFVSLGAVSNFCLKQTSTQRQNKSLDPINYRIYQILCNSLRFAVMLNFTLLALATLVYLFVRSLCGSTFPCLFCYLVMIIMVNSPL